MEFFRHCPECGRRFHIKLENRKMVHLERYTFRPLITAKPAAALTSRYGGGAARQPMIAYEGAPVTIDVEDFQYAYKCGHCGHEWTEKHSEKHKES